MARHEKNVQLLEISQSISNATRNGSSETRSHNRPVNKEMGI